MGKEKVSRKVLHLPNKNLVKYRKGNEIEGIRGMSIPRIIAITSGKGGVGKTNIVANLGF